MMLFDTDIFIWVQRGNTKAASLIEGSEKATCLSAAYIKLAEPPLNEKQHQQTKDFLITFDFPVLPVTENISHRACVYIEEYTLFHPA